MPLFQIIAVRNADGYLITILQRRPPMTTADKVIREFTPYNSVYVIKDMKLALKTAFIEKLEALYGKEEDDERPKRGEIYDKGIKDAIKVVEEYFK